MRLAVNPFKPVVESGLSSPLFPEDAMSFESAYSMFHGAQGVLPLGTARESKCLIEEPRSVAQVDAVCAKPNAVCLPLAAMSFSNNFGKPNFFQRLRSGAKKQGKGGEGEGSGARRSSRGGGRANAGKPGRGGIKGRAQNPRMSAGGRRPLGGPLGALGPLAALLPTTSAGHLRCPTAVVRMRGFVSSLTAVRGLRPHALPVRGAALMAVAMLGNIPAGMVREHCRKFSPAWFVAVHIAVPFVAMLRKAVFLPQWALALTIAGSMAGQVAGSRFERARVAGTLPRLETLGRLILPPPDEEEEQQQGAWPAFAAVSPSQQRLPAPVAVRA